MDPAQGRLFIAGRSIPMPRSRVARLCIGSALIVGGILGFLPILGFWMVPLGILILSQDLSFVRRRRRRLEVWWGRRRREKRAEAHRESR
jgi:purine-cytosine permease-like protein